MSRAVGASLLLIALVIGVPYLLVATVGNPFPSSIPTIDEIRILLTQNGQGFTKFLIGVLALLVWVIWIQLMVALLVEVVATIRHRETQRLRVAPGLQTFAARLIAALTLATTLAAGPLLAPAVGALSFAEVAHVSAPAITVANVAQHGQTEAAAAVRLDDSITTNIVVVADHTELWDLAEAAYGDGVSWKLIARANAGLPDAGGFVITSDTEMVAPGTELRLPGDIDATAMGSFGTLASDARSNRVVEPGDSMWTLAEAEVERRLGRPGTEAEVAEYWFDVVAANEDVSSGDIDLIYPGESLSLPGVLPSQVAENPASLSDSDTATAESDYQGGVDHSLRSTRSAAAAAALQGIVDGPVDSRNTAVGSQLSEDADLEPPAEVIPIGSARAGSTSPDQREAQRPEAPSLDRLPGATTTSNDSIPIPALGMTALGAAMLGAGVVSALRRRRDLQRRTRPVGTRARSASAEAAAFETAMAHMAHDVRESELGYGWRVLPAASAPALRPATADPASGPTRSLIAAPIVLRQQSPEPESVTARDVPQSPGPDTPGPDTPGPDTPGPWRQADELVVAAPPVEEATPASATPASATPASATPTTAPSTTTAVVGTDPVSGEAVLIDLAAIETLGLRGSDNDVRAVARSTVLDLAVSDRSDGLYVLAVGIAGELGDLDRVHPVDTFDDAVSVASRMGWLAADVTTPIVVVSGGAPNDDVALSTLRDAGVLVVGPQLQSELWIEIAGQGATIQPEGRRIVLTALDDEQYRSVTELVDTTSGAALELVDETVAVHDVLDVVTTAECPIEPGAREVKVLGPVEVAGADSFSSLKAVDVVAYLAFHRHGVDADQIKTWVWPTFDPPTDKAFANVMSRARTGLGADAEGSPYLSRAGADKTYRLAEAVTTDFDRFRALAELAEQAEDPVATLDLYRQALELIRGVPFTGGAASSFSWADNHVRAQVEYTIDEAVHRCADLALDAEDLGTARWAALKGLELVPGCEQCFRRRFLIARAGNNRSELRRAMADLEASAMVDLGEPEAVDLISGELLDLYHELDRALVGRAS